MAKSQQVNVELEPPEKAVFWLYFPAYSASAEACQHAIRAVYTRENKPRITESAAYVSREPSHLYDHSLYKKLVRGLRKPRTSFSCRL